MMIEKGREREKKKRDDENVEKLTVLCVSLAMRMKSCVCAPKVNGGKKSHSSGVGHWGWRAGKMRYTTQYTVYRSETMV